MIQASHISGVGGLQKLVVARVRCAPMTKKVVVALQLGKKLPSSGCLLHLRTILRLLQSLGRGKHMSLSLTGIGGSCGSGGEGAFAVGEEARAGGTFIEGGG
jgi:hypothetical protein